MSDIAQVGDYVPVPGPPGPPGPSGTSVEIRGELATSADLPGGTPGDAWLIAGDLWVWLAAAGTWANVGRIQGPDGLQGPPGAAGPQGTAGVAGAEGPAGTPGPAGLTPRGTWDNATPYVANDLVTHNGSSYAALAGSTNNNPETSPTKWQLLSARGPAGVDGAQGIQGPDGAQGPQGPVGPAGAAASISDAVYDQAAWGGVTDVAPSKKAVRDKFEALSGASEPQLVAGTLAARPAAATFGKGYYFATDDNGGTMYHSDASAWSQVSPGISQYGGRLLASGASTVDTSASSGVETALSGMSKTVTVGTRPILVKFGGGTYAAAAGGQPKLRLYEDSVLIDEGMQQNYTGTALGNVWKEVDLTPSAGNHTYEVRIFGGGSQVGHAFGYATSPIRLIILEG